MTGLGQPELRWLVSAPSDLSFLSKLAWLVPMVAGQPLWQSGSSQRVSRYRLRTSIHLSLLSHFTIQRKSQVLNQWEIDFTTWWKGPQSHTAKGGDTRSKGMWTFLQPTTCRYSCHFFFTVRQLWIREVLKPVEGHTATWFSFPSLITLVPATFRE